MQFVLIGLDGVDANAAARRQAVRSAHIARGDELLASGNLLYGAALLHDDGSMKGSLYVMNFPTEKELHKYLESEPYITGDVWREITIHKSNTRDLWQFSRSKEWCEENLA
jgi:uncharacterized protein YciI